MNAFDLLTTGLPTTVMVGCVAMAAGHGLADVVGRFAPSWNPLYLPVGLSVVLTTGWLVGAGPLAALVGTWCVVLSSIDLGSRRLPNVLTGTGAVGVVLYGVATGLLAPIAIGASVLFCCYLAVHLCAPAAFGAGDVKLAWPLGGVAAVAGPHAWVAAAILAPLLTGLAGVVMAVRQGKVSTLAHGPSMCVSTLLALAASPA